MRMRHLSKMSPACFITGNSVGPLLEASLLQKGSGFTFSSVSAALLECLISILGSNLDASSPAPSPLLSTSFVLTRETFNDSFLLSLLY